MNETHQSLVFLNGKPLCPHCLEKGIERKMCHAGKGNSGTKSYKAYRCSRSGCGYFCLSYGEPIESKT